MEGSQSPCCEVNQLDLPFPHSQHCPSWTFLLHLPCGLALASLNLFLLPATSFCLFSGLLQLQGPIFCSVLGSVLISCSLLMPLMISSIQCHLCMTPEADHPDLSPELHLFLPAVSWTTSLGPLKGRPHSANIQTHIADLPPLQVFLTQQAAVPPSHLLRSNT